MDLFDGDIIETEYEWVNRTWERMERENPEQRILGLTDKNGNPCRNPRGDCPCPVVPVCLVSEGVGAPSPSHSSEPTLELD